MKIIENKWIIMTKDRKRIAKGVPRDRWIIDMSNKKDKKRILTYNSKAKAEAAFKRSGFYGGRPDDQLEAVEVEVVMRYI